MPAKLKQPLGNKPKRTKDETYVDLLEQPVFTVMDIETSGLSPNTGGKIIELAAVRIVNGRITDTMSTLIDPKQPLFKKTTQITGLTTDDVAGQPTIEQVMPDFIRFIGNSVLVAHNARFEELFMNDAFKHTGYAPKNEWLCTMKLFRHFHPERKQAGLSAKLTDLTTHYQVSFTEEEHHRALPDTVATAKAFLEMRKEELDAEFIQNELFQHTDVEEMAPQESTKIDTFHITSIRYWEKCYNKKRDTWARRVYVRFMSGKRIHGAAYYDLYDKSWVVQECQDSLTKQDQPVDLAALEAKVLQELKQPDMHTYLKRIGVFADAHAYLKERTRDKMRFVEAHFDAIKAKHLGYKKAEIPYDEFVLTTQQGSMHIYVTNEKRGAKYRFFESVETIN